MEDLGWAVAGAQENRRREGYGRRGRKGQEVEVLRAREAEQFNSTMH